MTDSSYSSKQIDLFNEMNGPHPLIIAEGAVRSGKTYAQAQAFLVWALTSYPDGNFIIAGQTVASVRRNVLNEMWRFLTSLGIKYKWDISKSEMRVGKATFVIVGAHTEKSQDRIQGLTASGVLLDELVLLPRTFVMQALARMSFDDSKMWCNLNPGPPSHWVKRDVYEGMNPKVYKFLMDDNPTLGEATKQRYRNMFTGVFYQRYVLGEWVAAEGQIYMTWHVGEPPGTTAVVSRDVAVDYATSSVFSATVYEKHDNGKSYALREDYYDARVDAPLTDEQLVQRVVDLIGDNHIDTVIVDPNAASFKLTARNRGLPVRDGNNDVLDGIRTTAGVLAVGDLVISDRCEHKLKEILSYMWHADKQALGIDAPIKDNDHSMDEMRYYVMMRHQQRILTAQPKPIGY